MNFRKKGSPGLIARNALFLRSLDKYSLITLLLLLFVQLLACSYYVVEFPLHYDERFSWLFYSSESFEKVTTHYSEPNNHVFYNICTRLLLVTGLQDDIAIRIPSLIVSILTSYYFFKLCKNYFSAALSLLLMALLFTNSSFILYSYQGRGYAFINLFTVFLLYSSFKLSQDYNQGRYRFLFVLSQFLGFYTIPSFLYAVFPVTIALFFYLLINKKIKHIFLFIMDNLFVGLLVIAAYLPILLGEDANAFLHPEKWTTKFQIDDPNWFSELILYLDALFNHMFEFYGWKTAALLIVLTLIYFIRARVHQNLFLFYLSVFMFFSPVIILFLHQVLPMGRSLFYLLIPSYILLGFFIQAVFGNQWVYRFTGNYKKYAIVFYALIICAAGMISCKYRSKNLRDELLDYKLNVLWKNKLEPVIRDINEISRSDFWHTCYPAEVISFMAAMQDKENKIYVSLLHEVRGQGMLVIDETELPKYRKDLQNYTFIFYHEHYWIYMSNALLPGR